MDQSSSDEQSDNETTNLLESKAFEYSDIKVRTHSKCLSYGTDKLSSEGTVCFDVNLIKTSTTGDFTATWGGRRSQPESGRLRRTRSWSGGPPDDVSSEIRILRER